MTNAVQHSPAGSEVTVTLSEAPGEVAVRIRDRGDGIAADDLPHVFERF